MVSDQAGDALLAEPADVPCPVERVKAGGGNARRIPDVMQPGGREQGCPVFLSIQSLPGRLRPGRDSA